jgi:protocatechuate 3,4-dioxygenase beta subunit
VTEFGGRLLSADGRPVADATVELWQSDTNGCYLHTRGVPKGKERDPLFQGFGKIVTNEKGEYRFRTIKPGLYTGRTIHYHVAVQQGDKRMLTTQLFIAGVPENDKDGILKKMGTDEQRMSVIREFTPFSSGSDELFATWDIVIGMTPEEPQEKRRGPGGPPPQP